MMSVIDFRRAWGNRRIRSLAAAALMTTAVVPFAVAGTSPMAAGPVDTGPVAQTDGALMPGSFADLVERVSPAVVNVSSTRAEEPQTMPGMPQFPPGSPFEDFFRRFMPEDGMPGMEPHPATALGSGFIIDAEGYIVTNNHVVEGAETVSVTLHDGTELPATVIGRDAKTDLALVKVEADDPLPYLEFGDSDKARVGDWIIAVGSPFGLGGTVTSGIISARSRDINAGPYDDFLQLDAAINRGNSGGPTFDVNGEVIGINTAIFSPNGGSVGIGFAIPANLAKPVIEDLRENGHVDRGWLGVRIQEVTPDIAESLGLADAKGALVAEVLPDSPAAEAGLAQGDVILDFAGKPVEEVRTLSRTVAETDSGTKTDVTYWRNGEIRTLQATIEKLPEENTVASLEAPQGVPSSDSVLGLRLSRLDDAARARFGLDGSASGVLVVGTDPDAEADPAGVRPGDVIVSVGNEAVTTPAEVKEKVAQAEAAGRNAVLLLVRRGGDERFVAVEIDQA